MKIRVMIKEPYKVPHDAEIENTLEEFQRIVGGNIETVPCPGTRGVKIICNEEGKIKGLVPNLSIAPDVIVGTVIVVGTVIMYGDDDEEFVSLTEKQKNAAWLSLAVRSIHDPETIRRVTGYADGI